MPPTIIDVVGLPIPTKNIKSRLVLVADFDTVICDEDLDYILEQARGHGNIVVANFEILAPNKRSLL